MRSVWSVAAEEEEEDEERADAPLWATPALAEHSQLSWNSGLELLCRLGPLGDGFVRDLMRMAHGHCRMLF